jgi:phage N-6-adenine-methyltransferase
MIFFVRQGKETEQNIFCRIPFRISGNEFISFGRAHHTGCRYDVRIERKKTMSKSRGDEWYTPRALVEALRPFDIDPCAPSKNHWTARHCYTKEDDGLKLPWFGRFFLNPPYSEIDPWIDKAVEHRNGIALTFARTDTKWAHRAIEGSDGLFLFGGRIAFVDADEKKVGSAPAASVLIAFGEGNVEAIEDAAANGLIRGKMFFERSKARKVILPEERKFIPGADLGFNKLAAD